MTHPEWMLLEARDERKNPVTQSVNVYSEFFFCILRCILNIIMRQDIEVSWVIWDFNYNFFMLFIQ